MRGTGACTVVRLPDEIDLANDAAVRRALLDLVTPDLPGLVVDMTATVFCGLRGITAVAEACERAAALGLWACIVAPNRQVRRALQLAALDDVAPVLSTLEEALACADDHGTPSGVAH
jgi:anti-anti-sigma factor